MGESALKNFFVTLIPHSPGPGLGRIALASGFSTVGGTMCSLTFAYLAFSLTGSAFATVMVMVGYTLAYALFGPRGAAYLRRFDRRWVLVGTDSVKVINYSAVIFLQIAGLLDVPLIVISSAIGGLTAGAQYPAWQEVLQKLAPKGKLDEADGLFSSTSSIGAAIGAFTGGSLLALFGPVVPLTINVISYLPLMFVIGRLPAEVGKRSQVDKTSSPLPLREVAKLIFSNRLVRLGVLFFALLEFLAWPIISLLPKVAAEFGSSAHIYGILLGSFYFGGVLVAGLLVAAKRNFTYAGIIRFSLADIALVLIILAVVGFLPFGIVPSVGLSAILLVTLGIVLGIAGSILGAATQLSADPEHEGTVLAYYGAIGLGFGALGGVVEGLIADQLTIWWLPLASGILILVALLYLWRRRDFNPLDQADPELDRLKKHAVTGSPGLDAPYTSKVAGGGSRPLGADQSGTITKPAPAKAAKSPG